MPLLQLLAGPNGSGKSTYIERVLAAHADLPFVNADVVARDLWPDAQAEHAYEASRVAAERRTELLSVGASFVTETVFSHPSKLELIREAIHRDYLVFLHVILVPEELSVQRVADRVRRGGHNVPEEKIRQRWARLGNLVSAATQLAHRAEFFDNSSAAEPYRPLAAFAQGVPAGNIQWPRWVQPELAQL